MKKYNVYAGYYELFVTDKEMPLPRTWQCSFDTVEEVWSYLDEEDELTFIDEDIYYEMHGVDSLDLENPIGYVFKVDDVSGKIIVLSKDTIHLFH